MMKWLSSDVPVRWSQLLVRFVTIVIVGVVLLNIKEYMDAGKFDVPATLVDSAMTAAGVVTVNVLIMLAMPKRS